MARRDLGVRITLRCPDCGGEYETTTSAGTGLRPGQVVDQPHLFCPDAEDVVRVAGRMPGKATTARMTETGDDQ